MPEDEAYVPRAPDAAPHWPPPSRAAAIRLAREARLEEGGLAIDDATLERVADTVLDPHYDLPGLYYTPEELDDEVGDDVRAGVRAYLNRHPESDGGVRLGWRDGRRTLIVGIVGDLEAHRAALARIAGDRVSVEPRRRTSGDLDALLHRIVADRDGHAANGFRIPLAWPDPDRGLVHLEVVGGPDAAAAADFFRSRYGADLEVVWLGPEALREVPHPFGSWSAEGRRIRIFFGLDRNGEQRGAARVTEETDERIVVALTCRRPVGPTTLIGGFRPHHEDLELRAPVGGRAVVDASCGAVRPAFAQVRSR